VVGKLQALDPSSPMAHLRRASFDATGSVFADGYDATKVRGNKEWRKIDADGFDKLTTG
jgi:type IV secretory pathway VirB6-like protein